MGKSAVENGIASTSRKFTNYLWKKVTDTSVRSFGQRGKAVLEEITSWPGKETGRPLMLGRYNKDVVDNVNCTDNFQPMDQQVNKVLRTVSKMSSRLGSRIE